ncbi:MAG: carbohydrate ABC transporter permease [Anaerolineae bacterium]
MNRVQAAAAGGEAAYTQVTVSWKARKRLRHTVQATVGYVLLTVVSLVFLVPFVRMATTSLMTQQQILTVPQTWLPTFLVWRNYPDALGYFPFYTYLRNTMIICVFNVVATVLSCAVVAYGFSRIRWPGRDLLFALVLGTMMIPYHVTLIPTFLIFKWLRWLGTLKALTLPCLTGSPFYVFLLRQFFMTIPPDLSEMAEMDGAGDFRVFWSMILPLSKPALATVAVFTFLGNWNDFLWPLIVLGTDETKYTLSLGLYSYVGKHGTAWGPLMAACTLTTLPVIVLFFVAQRYFVEGITMVGIKG